MIRARRARIAIHVRIGETARRVALAGVLTLAGALLASPGWSDTQEVVRVTVGEHPTFGRVVLDAPGLTYSVERDGERLRIHFSGDPIIGALPPAPRDVLAIQPAPAGVALTLPPGAVVHVSRSGTKVVIDVTDAAPASAPTRAPTRESAPATPVASRQPVPATPTMPGSIAIPPISPAPGVARADGTGLTSASPGAPRATEAAAATSASGGARSGIADQAVWRTIANNAGVSASSAIVPAVAATPGTEPLPAGRAPAPAATAPAGTPRNPFSAPGARPNLPTTPDPGHTGAARAVAAPVPSPAAPTATPPTATPPTATPPTATPPTATPPTATPPTAIPPVRNGPVQVWPVTGAAIPTGPAPLVAVPAEPPGGLSGQAIRIPFDGAVGAAMFSRGAGTFIVFDERRSIDLSAVSGPRPFNAAVVTIFPGATVLSLTVPAGQFAILNPAESGWVVSVVAAPPRPDDLVRDISPRGIAFAADAAAHVVAIADPDSGATLLIGTQGVSGQAVLVQRATPEFLLPPTGQGIVVEPLSDAIALRATSTGFLLTGAPGGLVLSPTRPLFEAEARAAPLTRLFEFPRQSIADLALRTRRQAVAAAVAPPRARGPLRYALAQSMVGLGLGAEARTVLEVAMRDDPNEAASPATIGLAAIAAMLANRPEEASDLDNPRLTGTDEIALWRALRTAMADHASPAAAAALASTAPLLFTYPDELARRVLPLAMETMIRGGQADAAAALLAQRPNDPDLAYARALLLQARGNNAGALAAFEALSKSRSDYDHARAGARAVETRLAMGQLDANGAADGLDALLDAWRGGRRDLALRLRIAELRGKAGEWQRMFAMLRDAKANFPDAAAEIDRRLHDAFAAVPRDPALAKMPPAKLVALLDENAELMPDGADGEPMRQLLAKKLMALDLPRQADPVLAKLMHAAPGGPARADFGATLAALRLREGDTDGALLALNESNATDMADAVRERRTLIAARVQAKRGQLANALDLLAGDASPAADTARADIQEQARDWSGARDALAALVAKTVPPTGMLDKAALQLVLRLATDATHAADDKTLIGLRATFAARLGNGREADMFRLLTEAPVRGTADLARSRAELGLAGAVSADLAPATAAAKPP